MEVSAPGRPRSSKNYTQKFLEIGQRKLTAAAAGVSVYFYDPPVPSNAVVVKTPKGTRVEGNLFNAGF